MKETKVQWHPGFIAAMNLELTQNREDLLFEKEYNLNTKPLEIVPDLDYRYQGAGCRW